MTNWLASVGDILDANADALICSTNPQLNLSGGVGGAIALRYGTGMQEFLHDWLTQRGRRYIDPGEVIASPAFGSSFKVVIHAVAIDAFYDTSAEVIGKAYEQSFAALAQTDCRSVASACLACGYGHASPEMFLDAVKPFFSRALPGIERVEFISTNAELIGTIKREIDAHWRG